MKQKQKQKLPSLKKIKTILSVVVFITSTCIALGIAYGGLILTKFDKMISTLNRILPKLETATDLYIKEHEEEPLPMECDKNEK